LLSSLLAPPHSSATLPVFPPSLSLSLSLSSLCVARACLPELNVEGSEPIKTKAKKNFRGLFPNVLSTEEEHESEKIIHAALGKETEWQQSARYVPWIN
jgi:hypothetical protein